MHPSEKPHSGSLAWIFSGFALPLLEETFILNPFSSVGPFLLPVPHPQMF